MFSPERQSTLSTEMDLCELKWDNKELANEITITSHRKRVTVINYIPQIKHLQQNEPSILC